jgi:hypothetical protein
MLTTGPRREWPPSRVGPWNLGRRLGKGGNGEVWEARRDETEAVALKILLPRFQRADHQRFQRFRDEAQAQRSLQGESGILPIVDSHFPDQPSRNDPAWLATALAVPIKKALGPKADLRAIVRAVAAVADALARLHNSGITHRDVKPSNLYRHDGGWVLGDFGLVSFPGKSAKTRTGEQLGPLHYIAPEMMKDAKHSNGTKADVYSLAKTLWVLATRQNHPLAGEQFVRERGQTVTALLSDASAAPLDLLIERATRTDPAARPAMREVTDELEAWLTDPRRLSPAAEVTQLAAQVAAALMPSLRQAARRRELVGMALKADEEMRERLSEIAQSVATTGGWDGQIRTTNADDVFRSQKPLDHPISIWNRGLRLSVARPASPDDPLRLDKVELCCAVQFDLTADEKLWIVGGYAILSGYGPQIIWSSREVAPAGSALQDRAVAKVADGLLANLGPALTRLLQWLQWEGKGGLPPGFESPRAIG